METYADYGRGGTGETNFHPYDVEMDSTFGAALVTLDKSLHAVTLGIQRLFFHQGTINQGTHPSPAIFKHAPSPTSGGVWVNPRQTSVKREANSRLCLVALFNWWSDNQINAPYYGGYLAALALAGGDHIIELDSGNSSYAQYVIYSNGQPKKAVIVNTDYYSGSGARGLSNITLNGLSAFKAKALRMTAASSEVTTNGTSSYPTIGGM